MSGLIDRVYALRRWLLQVFDVETRGVKLLLHDEAGRVLLIRNRYGANHRVLPGGGIKRGNRRAMRHGARCARKPG